MRIKINHFLIIALLILIPIFAAAQEQSKQIERWELNNRLLNCEMSLVYQEHITQVALEQTKRDGVLIVIARLGDGENSHKLNRRRLYNVHKYLNEHGGLATDKIIVAEGERVKGYGRLEYYLGGELFEQLLLSKNGYLCHDCCGPDDRRYYPDKEFYDRAEKQKQKRRS